jgi:hypothetical protein
MPYKQEYIKILYIFSILGTKIPARKKFRSPDVGLNAEFFNRFVIFVQFVRIPDNILGQFSLIVTQAFQLQLQIVAHRRNH